MMSLILILIIPLLGTIIGSSLIFFLRNKMSNEMEKLLLGLSSGIMLAASVFSLIIPSINLSKNLDKYSWFPPLFVFCIGIVFLLLLNDLILNLYKKHNKNNYNNKSALMLIVAVILHNIPEGLAIGVTISGLLFSNSITLTSIISLSLAMAIQNIPEGCLISFNLKSNGKSKSYSFFIGLLSAIVEPISALISIVITKLVVIILPYILAFAAGAMIYVVVEELLPKSQINKSSKVMIIGFSIGFSLMLFLDIIFD